MATNRYDTPAQDTYRNTYVGLPFQEIMATVGARQAQNDRQQEALLKTFEDTQNLKYIPGTKDEQYVKDYLAKAGDMVNKYMAADMSDPIVRGQLRRDFNSITNPTRLQDTQLSYANWMSNQKQKASLKEQGQYNDILDLAKDPANANFSSENGNVYQYQTNAFKNHRPVAEQFFNNLGNSIFRDDKGDIAYTKEGYILAGKNQAMTDRVINTRWSDFDNTPEGHDAVTLALKQNGLDDTNPEYRQQVAKKLLQEVAPEFWDETIVGSRAPKATGRGSAAANGIYENTTIDQTMRSSKNFNPFGLRETDFDEKGNINMSDKPYLPDIGVDYYRDKQNVASLTKEQKSQISQEARTKLKEIRDNIPAFKNMSDKETYNAYRQLTKDGQAIEDLPEVILPDVVNMGLAKHLVSNLSNRNASLQDEYGTTENRNVNDVNEGSAMRDAGYTPQTLKEELAKFANGDSKAKATISGIAQNGPEAGMVIVELQDLSKKGEGRKGSIGKTRKLYISNDKEPRDIFTPTKEVYDNIRNLRTGITPIGLDADGKQVAVRVVPDVTKDDKGKWVYDYKLEEGYQTKDGFQKTGNTSMEELRKFQLNQLMDSNFINSQINYTKNTAPSF
jgi:hypothetical protein